MDRQSDLLRICKSKRGFTMVELLMTITLIGVLSAIATTQYLDFRREARTQATLKKLHELREVLVGNPEIVANGTYVRPGMLVDLGMVPLGLDDFITIPDDPLNPGNPRYQPYNQFEKSGWRGPYVDVGNGTSWSEDAWGNDFEFSGSPRWIRSCGQDTVCGDGSDDLYIFY